MFALEIHFQDGISSPETILVRRSNAIIGSSDRAHVVIEGAASSLCELRLVRGLGREFSCHPVRRVGQNVSPPTFLEGVYSGSVSLKLGDLSVNITSLDIDLGYRSDEFPDQAAIRVMRTALNTSSPVFPAVAVIGARPTFVSFPENEELTVGRSKDCGLRLDAFDVSAVHASIGVEDGRFWIQDLGSTNGTFVGEERVSGKRYLDRGESVSIGSEFAVVPVSNIDDVNNLHSEATRFPDVSVESNYPCIFTEGPQVRPRRFPLERGEKVTVGRDPASDIWISAPHISRNHLEFTWDEAGELYINDLSRNGIFLNHKKLPGKEAMKVDDEPIILDLCAGVTMGVCYSESDEDLFYSFSADRVIRALPGGASQAVGAHEEYAIDGTLTPEAELYTEHSEVKTSSVGGIQQDLERNNTINSVDGSLSASQYMMSSDGEEFLTEVLPAIGRDSTQQERGYPLTSSSYSEESPFLDEGDLREHGGEGYHGAGEYAHGYDDFSRFSGFGKGFWIAVSVCLAVTVIIFCIIALKSEHFY